MGVAMIGFNAMVALGWLDAGKTVYAGPRFIWLSALVGGAMFGFGMVLASGCGSKTLVRIGGGNLKSLVVFFVLGIAAFATLRGITAVLRVATVDTVAIELRRRAGPALAARRRHRHGARPTLAGVLGIGLGGALLAWALVAARRPQRRQPARRAWASAPWSRCVWWVSGRLGHVAEDPNTLQEAFVATNSQRMESLSFVAPMAYTLDWLMFFSDKSKRADDRHRQRRSAWWSGSALVRARHAQLSLGRLSRRAGHRQPPGRRAC